MAKASKNGKKKNNSIGFKLPPQLPALMALIVAALLLMALVSYRTADPSAFGPAAEPGGLVQNCLGILGAFSASFLIQFFGLGAFWPLPALLVFAWISLKKRRIGLSFAFKIAGWGLFLFATLAVLALIWPNWPWAGYSAGGRFGLFLTGGATPFLGRAGSFLILPLLSFTGLLMAITPLRQRFLGWFDRFMSSEPEPSPGPGAVRDEGTPAWEAPSTGGKKAKSDPGLEEDPLNPPPPPLIVEKPAPTAKVKKEPERPTPARPVRTSGNPGPYQLPHTNFLDASPPDRTGHASGLSREDLMENAHLLEAKLRDFGVDGRVLEVSGGPVITMYEYQPAPGIKISKVAGLSDDLTMAMRAISIRVVAPLPGKAAIGIEIPNPRRSLVSFREVVESPVFQDSASVLSLVLGVDIMGAPVVADLARMPHLLIAGATGSGKSVGLGSMIMSILYKARPDQVRFLMIDPKCVELALYKDIPHLIYPVLSDPSEATLGLKWAVAEMDLRYKLLAEKGVRNIETYNSKIREELKNWKPPRVDDDDELAEPPEPPRELPFLVIIIDELADLMMVSAKEVEVYITRLAQKARAAGIHLILATQRPSVDVLTGIIKANMPTRISFQVSSRIDSRTILDQMGAEKLLGAGDMLFLPPGVGKLRRLHGAFVSDDEIKTVTDFIREWGPPDYLEDLSLPEAENDDGDGGERDEKYDDAVELVRRSQKATISHVQRHLRIGYNRAARIIEDMEREGIIGPQDGTRPRAIF